MRLALALLAPALALLLLEGGLRLFGYGTATEFLVLHKPSNTYQPGAAFIGLFADKSVAPDPPILVVPAVKPPSTIRIFILGESAAQGVPEPAYSFARVLEEMLRQRHPERRFEVLNASVTAMNSHVILPMARECAQRDGDLFILYIGNNECVGPFGPSTAFRGYSSSLAAIRAGVYVRSTRTGQLLQTLLTSPKDPSTATGFTGMEMFAAGIQAPWDPRRDGVREHYRANLSDIISTVRGRGARVIVSTVAANLADCPPFASLHHASADQAAWKAAVATAESCEQKQDWDGAARAWQAAVMASGQHAETRYRLARTYQLRRAGPVAAHDFQQALDLDALQFRTDSKQNQILRELVASKQDPGVVLADVQAALNADAAERQEVLGNRLFWEHVHLRFEGNYLVARTLLPLVEKSLGIASAAPAPSMQSCADGLAYTPLDEHAMAASMLEMTARPPFTSQWDHDSSWKKTEQSLRAWRLPADAEKRQIETYRAAVKQRPDDLLLRLRYAERLLDSGQAAESRRVLDTLNDTLGHNADVRQLHALAIGRGGDYPKALPLLQALAAEYPRKARMHKHIGDNFLAQGKYEEASTAYRRTTELLPRYSAAWLNLGVARLALKDEAGAVAAYNKAIEIDNDAEAHINVGIRDMHAGRMDAALAHFRAALEQRPNSAKAHNLIAAIHLQARRTSDAIAELRLAIEADPNHVKSLTLLAQLLLNNGQMEESISLLRRAVDAGSDNPAHAAMVAWALATHANGRIRDGEAAVIYARKACEQTKYSNVDHIEALAAALAETGKFDQAREWIAKADALAVSQSLSAQRMARIRYAADRYKDRSPFRK